MRLIVAASCLILLCQVSFAQSADAPQAAPPRDEGKPAAQKADQASPAETLTPAQALVPIFQKCQRALDDKATASSLDLCKQSLDLSLKAGELTEFDQLAMMNSHMSYGRALALAKRYDDALAEVNKAVEVAKAHLKVSDEQYAMPFYWRAMVELHLRQTDAAFTDLSIAEATYGRAIAAKPEMRDKYSHFLVSTLMQHASLLDRMARPAEAAKLREEVRAITGR